MRVRVFHVERVVVNTLCVRGLCVLCGELFHVEHIVEHVCVMVRGTPQPLKLGKMKGVFAPKL